MAVLLPCLAAAAAACCCCTAAPRCTSLLLHGQLMCRACRRCAAGCATVAEVRKRGDEFWSEFEFYLSDLLVS